MTRTTFPSLRLWMLCASLLLTGLAGPARPASAQIGPVNPTTGHPIVYLGVVYFAKYDTAIDRQELESIITAFGGTNRTTYRVGRAYDVQLVIQSELAWYDSEGAGAVNASDPVAMQAAFKKYQDFAALIQELKLVWTPLLSYHYTPGWVTTKYAKDAMPNRFMPFIPQSAVWSQEASAWTRKAMQQLSPYFGTSIKAVLCGNEMMTAKRPGEIAPTPAELDARSSAWANAIASLVNAAKSVVQGRVPVTSKLFPYETHATEMLQTSVFPHVYDLLDSLDVIGIDAYPPSHAEYQAFFRSNKATYLAEFNKAEGFSAATRNDVLSWIQLGVSRYNVRYATWFCWKCVPDKPGEIDYSMTADQKLGLNDAINWLLNLNAVYTLPTRSVAFQFSKNVLNKIHPDWMIPEGEAYRQEAALTLATKLPYFQVRYEIDYRPRTADVQIVQVIDHQSVSSFSRRAIYLLESPYARISAPEGSFFVSGDSGNSDGKVTYTPSLAPGTQVFDWTPQWDFEGVRRLASQYVTPSVWVTSPGGVPVAGKYGNSFFIAQGTLHQLYYRPDRPLPTLLGDMINSPAVCAEGSCVPSQGMYISHFSGPNCTGTESYYVPYDNYAYSCRTWNGTGQCGTVRRTVTNYSAKINGGTCQELWPTGNTLSNFVTVFR